MKKAVFVVIVCFVAMISCKTTTPVVKETAINNDQPKLKNYGIGKLLDSVNSKYLQYSSLSVKFKLSAEFAQSNHQLEGIFRIKKDSVIWISLNAPLGIEVARVVLFADSMIFLNKLKREYLIKPYSYFEQFIHAELAYKDIQSILTNEIFLFSETDEENNLAMNENSSEKEFIRKTFFRDKDSVNYILKTHRKHKIKRMIKRPIRDDKKNIVENIKIQPKTFKVQTVEIFDYVENRYLLISYNDFQPTQNSLFPNTVNFLVKDSTKTFNLTLTYTKITIDHLFNFNVTIPESYKKIE